ncbi:TetR/AcrR family transcriptional regulator [Kineosporia sp. NBRC 101731]|uniref:TetR/AcrR family transcriptional regulator n=1 Tax=Kineosporia sp. NBRC 101731 TaxID=3032199 RepID=UPI0024A029CC|nr:TetR/AcrR family transcriptional regulator [Kineosporia sp. NBRC 101731]GLY29623.1 TetR family transcriptional regulator [Kineosporia sp. NBRC 101731]
MTSTGGKREANKLATRTALQAAADRLFEQQGFENTTVRDIADAAGVTERTFFRYFAAKEELILDDALSWLPDLTEAIRTRPAAEGPLTAVQMGLATVAWKIAQGNRPSPLWMFHEGPPGPKLRRAPNAVGFRVEEAIAIPLRARLIAASTPNSDDPEPQFVADILARASLAALRSGLIRDWELRDRDAENRPPLSQLIQQAFATIIAVHD